MAVDCEINCHFFYIHNMSIKKLYNKIYADIQYWIVDIIRKSKLFHIYVRLPQEYLNMVKDNYDIKSLQLLFNLSRFKKVPKSVKNEIIIRHITRQPNY